MTQYSGFHVVLCRFMMVGLEKFNLRRITNDVSCSVNDHKPKSCIGEVPPEELALFPSSIQTCLVGILLYIVSWAIAHLPWHYWNQAFIRLVRAGDWDIFMRCRRRIGCARLVVSNDACIVRRTLGADRATVVRKFSPNPVVTVGDIRVFHGLCFDDYGISLP